MKKYTNQGFTLIELLVVIAIIGILSGIVLTSLSGARNKASDARVQSDISGFRTAAELFFTNNGNSYVGTSLDICNSGATETGPYIKGLTTNAVEPVCNATPTAYGIAKPLVSDGAKSWCADSTGFSGQITTTAFVEGAGDVTCN